MSESSIYETQRLSRRRSKRKNDPNNSDSDDSQPPPRKECEQANCEIMPVCIASAAEKCAGINYTPRWIHISYGEHCCTDCFNYFYQPSKEGNGLFKDWCQIWAYNKADSLPGVREFIADTILSYWLRCGKCKKWRQVHKKVEVKPDFVANFTCSQLYTWDESPCSFKEDPRTFIVKEKDWIAGLMQPPLLECPFLAKQLKGYSPDLCGLSPKSFDFDEDEEEEEEEDIKLLIPDEYAKLIQPFRPFELKEKPHIFFQAKETAGLIDPDQMDEEEQEEFSEYKDEPKMYLGTRNLIVALWNKNPKEWLSLQTVENHLICRGQARIRCIFEAESILRFLSARGIINFGLVVPPSNFIFDQTVQNHPIIVVGAGISGLAAARSLSNMGFKVTVLESRRRIGGRLSDDSHHFGVCVGKGNQEINGALNNPLTILALQAGAEIDPLNEDDLKFVESITKEEVNRALLHFYLLLDSPPDEWKMESPVPDYSLYEKLCQFHKLFLTESSSQFTEAQLRVFYLAMGMLEAQLGSDLEAVSSLYWDESDKFPQYGGPACCRVTSGFHAILTKMAQGLTIKLNSEVTKIDFSKEDVQVHTLNSNVYSSSKVVVTVPVSLMPDITFEPELPSYKINAIRSIGIGNCEKVILKFEKRFWMENTPAFACLPEFESRNQINHFKDLTYKKKEGPFVLEVVLGGRAVAWLQEKTDIEVVEACLTKLRQLFPDGFVESPLGWCVTRWYQQPGSKMARSFIRPDTTSQIYDDLSLPVDNKVYFAGEATFRPIPGSIVGAYLSGIRAARALYESYLPEDDEDSLHSPIHIKEEIPDCI